MGQCSFKHDNDLTHGGQNISKSLRNLNSALSALATNLSKNNFDFKFVIGRGGFGKVCVNMNNFLFNEIIN